MFIIKNYLEKTIKILYFYFQYNIIKILHHIQAIYKCYYYFKIIYLALFNIYINNLIYYIK